MFDTGQLLELGADLAQCDVRLATDDELLNAAVAGERFDSLFGVTRAHVLAELDARGSCVERFGLRTATWVAREADSSPVTIGGALKVGRMLREHFDVLDAAVVAGVVSMDHARAVVGVANRRNVDGLAALQDEIVANADGVVFGEWRDTIRRLADLLDADGLPPSIDDNELTLLDGLDGMGELRGKFTAEQWLVIKTAVNDRADVLFREFVRMNKLTPEIEVPARKTLLALALEQLIREGLGIDIESTEGPRTDATIIIRPGDAEHGEPDVAVDRDGVRLPTSVLPMFLCDPTFTAVLVDSLGVPLDLGRTQRYGNRAQRRAAAARDGGCTFPGCDKPIRWTHLHHAEHYEDGGLTDLSNMPSLCALHHGIVHRKGWAVHVTDDGWFWFQTPTGQIFWAQRHRRRRTDPPPPPRRSGHGTQAAA